MTGIIHPLLRLAASLLLAFPLPGGATPPGQPDCSVPPELAESDLRLPELAQRLRDKLPVIVVAIGGAATAGLATGNAPEASYPSRLQDILRRRHPGVPITVLNKGAAQQTTQDMVDRFPRDVFARSPALVIWETGTVDAARDVNIDAFAGALEDGLARLNKHHVGTILIDMQYSSITDAIISFEPYLDAMHHIADVYGIYLFPRFEMMKYWSEAGVFHLVDVAKERRGALAAAVYECLAERLADAIEHSTQ